MYFLIDDTIAIAAKADANGEWLLGVPDTYNVPAGTYTWMLRVCYKTASGTPVTYTAYDTDIGLGSITAGGGVMPGGGLTGSSVAGGAAGQVKASGAYTTGTGWATTTLSSHASMIARVNGGGQVYNSLSNLGTNIYTGSVAGNSTSGNWPSTGFITNSNLITGTTYKEVVWLEQVNGSGGSSFTGYFGPFGAVAP